jgi:hypothetical protein
MPPNPTAGFDMFSASGALRAASCILTVRLGIDRRRRDV